MGSGDYREVIKRGRNREMVSSKKRGGGQRIKKIISLLKIKKKKSLSVITDGIAQLVKDSNEPN